MSNDNLADFQLPPAEGVAAQKQEPLTDFALPGRETPAAERDWGQASAGEVAMSALRNAPASAWHQITAIPEAIMHPQQTYEGMKMLGRGALSKAGLGGSDDPEQRAKDESVIDALIAPYKSEAGFKKSFATDPFEFLTTAGLILSGGATGLTKAGTALASTGTKAGKVAGTIASGLGKGASGLAYGMDPTARVLDATTFAVKKGLVPAAKGYVETATGVPSQAMEHAFEAGASKNPLIKKSFNDYAAGRGDPVSFSQDTARAFQKMRADEIGKWASDKANLAQLGSTVDFKPVYDALDEFRKNIGPAQGGVGPEVARAHNILDAVEDHLKFRESLPGDDLLRTVEGVDQLKRSLYKDMQASSGYAAEAYKKAWAGVREALSEAAPEYTNLMEKYQAVQDGLQNIEKTLGTGNRVAANTEMAKFIRQFGDAFGMKEIEKLAKYDPTIPYKVAGASIHDAMGSPSNWGKAMNLGHIANFGYGLYNMDIPHLMQATGVLAAQKALGNRSVVGGVPYLAGKISESTPYKGAKIGAEVARQVGTPAAMHYQDVMTDYTGEKPGFPFVRPGRASGGRITSHEQISDKLVRLAEQVKKDVSSHTEKLLETPDDHVAKALEVANRHI